MKEITILLCLLITANTYSYSPEIVKYIEVKKDTSSYKFVDTPDLYKENWHQLAQPNFWKSIMRMSPDSCLINVASTRQVLHKESLAKWNLMNDEQKDLARQKFRELYGIDTSERVYMTTGKSDFFQFNHVYPSISKAVDIFAKNETDPWYAQSILMIESPGKIAYSNVGAYGPFQLMKGVARNHGLRVDKYIDERKNFAKSAYASAHLLRTSCVPEAKRILRKFNITVTKAMEHSLWFRLLVLHNYHAGAGNVDKLLVNVVKPNYGSQDLITSIWQSTYGRFKNSSQNYSQLALASLLVLNDFIDMECDRTDTEIGAPANKL